ncbi:MAG: hypothetical protein ACRDVG_10840, partial [Jatrophihabitantaceae bacterium]
GFVQMGWYVCGNPVVGGSKLPYYTTPHIWVGEYNPGTGSETLRTFGALAWNTKVGFRIVRQGANVDFYVNGIYLTSALYGHSYVNQPGFTAETHTNHVSMWGDAENDSVPWATLQYYDYTTAIWDYFGGAAVYTADLPYSSYPENGNATDLASGGGNC